MSTLIPRQPGFYWAQWRISDYDHALPPVGKWEIVELWQNTFDPTDSEYLKVSITGVENSESPENFVWGEGPLIRPENPT
jgi:hypothetical protein